jgi:hypothetical protein
MMFLILVVASNLELEYLHVPEYPLLLPLFW